MATAQKFTFDTVFGADGEILREPGGRKVIFTLEEVEAERRSAYEAGCKAETVRAEQHAAAALDAVARAAQRVLAAVEAERRTLAHEASELARAAARAIAGAALDAYGVERVETLVEEVIAGLRGAPRLVIRLAEQDAERLAPRLAAIAQDHGFAGALAIRAEAGLASGDVTLDWGQGAVALNREEAAARVEAILARAAANLERKEALA